MTVVPNYQRSNRPRFIHLIRSLSILCWNTIAGCHIYLSKLQTDLTLLQFTMFTAKPTSRSVFFSLLLLLLLATSLSSEPTAPDEDSDDLGDLQELIALDEEADLSSEGGRDESKDKPSGAELLSRAQRIVLELNSDNTKSAIDGNEYVLVLGYAPWSETSAELMPRFAEAATALKESGSPVLMAKVDAERHPKIASNLGIKGFPTMLLFVNGSSQPYTGGFSAYAIPFATYLDNLDCFNGDSKKDSVL